MDKYYDQKCPDCGQCGWLKGGSYPDGRPYEACEWYGYILHETVMAKCEGFMTGGQVAEFKSRGARKKTAQGRKGLR